MDAQEPNEHLNQSKNDTATIFAPRPFKMHLEDAFLDMTVSKVRNYRATAGLSAKWDDEGPPTCEIVSVAQYWASEYSWRTVEKKINDRFAQFTTVVPGSGEYLSPIPLHFIHHRSYREDAIPLLLLHGWPSSFLEWSKVIKPLTNYQEHSFHVVAPNLPGFGMSPAPVAKGLGPREMARAFDALMWQLGYAKYGIVTTDLGWFIGMWMVNVCGSSIIGHMSDFYISPPKEEDRARIRESTASKEEVAYTAAFDNWFGSHWGYATIHGQKPLALSLALGDSPVGLLGWYWDVNYATSDGYKYSYEELITDAMMLWIPGPYANVRAYQEMFKPYVMDFPASDVPTGVSEWNWGNGPFPDIADFAYVPQEWIQRTSNLQFFRRHGAGGHFPAVSHPKEWVEDVRAFFTELAESEATPTKTS